MKIEFINGTPYHPVTHLEPVEKPSWNQKRQHINYARGRHDRLEGKPCASAIGSYLDGWYSPERPFYFISEAQSIAFKIPA